MIGVAVLAVGATVGISAVGADSPKRSGSSTDASTRAPKRSTAEVRRTDLVDNEDLDGTLGYGDPTEVTVGRQGIVTALPEVGSTVDRGGSVAEVNGLPVPVLFGTRPFWRKLTADPVGADGQPTDDMTGPDVRILEENLQALGFITATGPAAAKVDDTFTGSTAEAVKAWQKSLGMPQTGVVEATDVVVQPAAVRIAEHKAALGAPSGGPVVSVTGTQRRITVQLAATRRDLLAAGDVVHVTLPDDTVLGAKIVTVGSVVTPGNDKQGTSDTIEVVVGLDDPAAAGSLDAAPVTVSVVRSTATAVLAVPVGALMALAEGGYAVERVGTSEGRGDGTTLVGVKIGAFADGLVQVEGDLAEGDEVVVPS